MSNPTVALVGNSYDPVSGTGIGRYNFELVRALGEQGVDASCIRPTVFPPSSIGAHLVDLPVHVAIARRRYHVLHATEPATALSVVFGPRPRVVTFHDLSSIMCPGDSGRLAGLLYRGFRDLASRFDAILANSSTTRMHLTRLLGIDSSKIAVTPLGVSNQFGPPTPRNQKTTVGYIGKVTPRKRLHLLLDAFEKFEKRNLGIGATLLICGRTSPTLRRELARYRKRLTRLTHIPPVNEIQLPALYRSMAILVVPSSLEGFGLPILEAGRSGVPVIVMEDADIPPEVSSACVQASDVNDLSSKIEELLTDDVYYRRIAEKGIRHSEEFTWGRTAALTREVYESVS